MTLLTLDTTLRHEQWWTPSFSTNISSSARLFTIYRHDDYRVISSSSSSLSYFQNIYFSIRWGHHHFQLLHIDWAIHISWLFLFSDITLLFLFFFHILMSYSFHQSEWNTVITAFSPTLLCFSFFSIFSPYFLLLLRAAGCFDFHGDELPLITPLALQRYLFIDYAWQTLDRDI